MKNKFLLFLIGSLSLLLGVQNVCLSASFISINSQSEIVKEISIAEVKNSISSGEIFWQTEQDRDSSVYYGKDFTSHLSQDTELNSKEKLIAQEAYEILNSPKFQDLIIAHKNCKYTLVEINGRSISYDDAPFSGMTWFEKNGFNIGREAFESQEELIKTVLHELHRLTTSKLRGSGKAEEVSKETKAAFNFAEKAYYLFE